MTFAALFTVFYGLAMAGGGYLGYRRASSTPSLVGGLVIGALALVGGFAMLGGNVSGRGFAMLGAVLAALFFGWRSSQAILNQRPVGRSVGILALSAVEIFVLIRVSP